MNCKLILSMLCCASLTLFSAEQPSKWHIHTHSQEYHPQKTEEVFQKIHSEKTQLERKKILGNGQTAYIGSTGRTTKEMDLVDLGRGKEFHYAFIIAPETQEKILVGAVLTECYDVKGYWGKTSTRSGYITIVQVAKPYHRNKIAEELMQDAMTSLLKCGAKIIRLKVDGGRSNKAAVALYKKFSFEEEEMIDYDETAKATAILPMVYKPKN